MDYASIYNESFFNHADGIGEWHLRKLRYGDAMCAIGYALGAKNLEEVRAVVPFEGLGKSAPDDGLDANGQIAALLARFLRRPSGIVEIGGGRGEVSVGLALNGFNVQCIEPCPGAESWFHRTLTHVYLTGTTISNRTINRPLPEAIEDVDWSLVDTVMMVESLEHILAEDFEPIYPLIVESLRKQHGRLIIANWVDYHPIRVGDFAPPNIHCRLVDEALYDRFSQDAARVVFRYGSHLVLDY